MLMETTATRFWNWFALRQEQLKCLFCLDMDTQAHLVDQLNNHLYYYCEELEVIIKFDPEASTAELIITAWGNPEYFEMANTLAHAAPVMPGWTITCLRPTQVDVEWLIEPGEIKVDPQAMQFAPRTAHGMFDGIRVFIPGYNYTREEEYYTLVLDMLINLLGEETFGYEVTFFGLARLPESKIPAGLRPFLDLPEFLEEYWLGKTL